MSLNRAARQRRRLRERLMRKQRGLCFYCKTPVSHDLALYKCGVVMPDAITVDHKKLKSEGGTLAHENVVGACWACNQRRGNMPFEEFCARMRCDP